MQVWLAEATAQQRTLLVSRHEPQRGVETSDVVLSFSASSGRCTLSVLRASDMAWTHMQRLSSPSVPLLGILGLLKMGTDIYLACITHAERVGSLHDDQWIRRVRGVTFFCINRAVRDEEFQYGIDPQEYGRSTTPSAPAENPCASIRKYMNSGSFFFAERCAFDLTRRIARIESHSDIDQQFSSQYAWNAYMMEPILQFRTRLDPSQRAELDSAALLVLVIQGYVGMASFLLGPERRDKGTLAVISRLSARRAGTRFNARGIDDQGYAANFAETETVLAFGEDVMSFVQVRGSVPLFWEQQGLQALNARIQITRTGAATQPAFEQHMQRLLAEYERVFALDLLGTRDAETMLSQAYVQHIDAMLEHLPWHHDEKPLRYYNFDFHTITKATGGLDGTRAELDRLNNVQTQRQYNGYTLVQYHTNYIEQLMTQTGVFRVNCFDCLDRTNVVQGCLSHAALRDFFRTLTREKYDDTNLVLLRDTPGLPEALWPLHGRLWAENGDTLSQISTGTGSLNSDYMRSGTKKFFSGLLSDAAKSASRYVALPHPACT
ncbi:phosphoinositide 5-phosphatase [Malassezia furfur]|uniref:Phosphoinositide 5-phosphatase n=1 Tax=Malassezia furfur TaxID=55194 RepID=A0ABY8ER04_MALFU|nr:phosphoinositide 5-phosphatase [Malassezia furfur]